jgi:hypothetical protein
MVRVTFVGLDTLDEFPHQMGEIADKVRRGDKLAQINRYADDNAQSFFRNDLGLDWRMAWDMEIARRIIWECQDVFYLKTVLKLKTVLGDSTPIP